MIGTLTGIATMVPYLLVAFVALWLACRVQALTGRSNGAAMMASGNLADGIRMAGLFIAIGIGLSGVFAGSSRGFVADVTVSAGYALALIVITLIALKISDFLILPSIDNSDEISRGNVAVAAVEFGGMIATGLIARGAVMGESGGWLTALVFFILGQVAMVLMVRIYELIKESQYSLVSEVGRGNTAAGILLGGKLWAYGLIMAAAVSGNFTGWTQDITAFVITAAAGMVFLFVAEWLVDKMIVTQHSAKEIVAEGHVQSALKLAAGKIGMAYVISTVAL